MMHTSPISSSQLLAWRKLCGFLGKYDYLNLPPTPAIATCESQFHLRSYLFFSPVLKLVD